MSESISRTEFEIATLQAQIDQLQERHDLLRAAEAMRESILLQLERTIEILNQVSPNQVAAFKAQVEAKFETPELIAPETAKVISIPDISRKASSKPDKAKTLIAIFGERTKQYQQFLVIRRELSAIGIKVGKLIKSRDDVKDWQLDWSGDKAGLYWTVGAGWSVEAIESGAELTGGWEDFDLIEHLDCNGIDLDPDEELAS